MQQLALSLDARMKSYRYVKSNEST